MGNETDNLLTAALLDSSCRADIGLHAQRDYLRLFKQRLAYVDGQIAKGISSPGSLNFFKAERLALSWAIPILEEHVIRERAEQVVLQL